MKWKFSDKNGEMKLGALYGCLVAFLLVALYVVISAIVAFAFMILWNATLPYLFSVPTINFWISWAMVALLSIIGGILNPRR